MKPSDSLAARMLEIYEQWLRGSDEGFGSFWSGSDTALAIGTDPAEYWEGYRRIVGTWNAQSAVLHAREFESRALRAHVDKSSGWASDDVLVRFDSGEVARFRFTAVFRLEHGNWMLVQWHASHGVDNAPNVPVAVDAIAEAVARNPDLHPAMARDGTVAVLFSDIEGSTVLANTLGDREWMDVLGWHNERVRAAIADSHGYEVKAQGDGFMVAFASPRDAVTCALALQRGLESAPFGFPLRVRVGIHHGKALVEDDDFFGRTVIAAARIAAQASGGEILVSDAVRSANQTAKFEGPRSVSLKGFDEPWLVFSVRRNESVSENT